MKDAFNFITDYDFFNTFRILDLIIVKVNFIYEGMKIVYFQPEIKKTYTPDFPIQNTQLVIETKGAFNSADRKKMKTIKAQNPNLDIRFIFSNSKT